MAAPSRRFQVRRTLGGLLLALSIASAGGAWHLTRTWAQRLPPVPSQPMPASLSGEIAATRSRATTWWQPGRQTQALRELAFLFHANGHWPEAAAVYRLLADREADRAEWPLLAADVALNAGDPARAIEHLERAVAIDRTQADAWAILGDLRYKAGESAAAEQAYGAALASGANATAELGLARLALDRADRRVAIDRLQRALAADSALGAAYALLATVLEADGQARRARVIATLAAKYASVPARPGRALEQVLPFTRDVERLAVLADLALLRGQPEAARGWAERATAADPQAWRAWLTVGVVNERLGRLDAAKRGYERALELGGDRVTLGLELAAVARRAGDFAAARARLLEAESQGVSLARIRNALGELELAAGDRALAERRFRESLAADPQAIVAMRNLGQMLWESGRTAEALPLLERVRTADPLDFAARAALGEECARRGDHAAALEYFREAIDLEPGHAELRTLAARSALTLARQAAGRRDTDSALGHARVAIELAPDMFEPLAHLAALAAASNRSREALAPAEAYAARHPRDAKGWLLLGDLRAMLDQVEGARDAWQRARAAAPSEPALQQEIAQRLNRPAAR